MYLKYMNEWESPNEPNKVEVDVEKSIRTDIPPRLYRDKFEEETAIHFAFKKGDDHKKLYPIWKSQKRHFHTIILVLTQRMVYWIIYYYCQDVDYATLNKLVTLAIGNNDPVLIMQAIIIYS